jgi:hypothetical protein
MSDLNLQFREVRNQLDRLPAEERPGSSGRTKQAAATLFYFLPALALFEHMPQTRHSETRTFDSFAALPLHCKTRR